MQNSFNVVQDNYYDRRFGGTKKGVADPYISGYHFIYFKSLPPDLISNISVAMGDSSMGDETLVRRTLSGSCLSVTPPGGTLNKTEFTGLGGTKWAVPTNFDYGNTLTVRFLEYSDTPILNIFHGWIRMIRDYRAGISTLQGDNYTKSNYSSNLLYWTTKPDGLTVEYYACYTGVFPTKDPQDLYTGDLTAVDKLEVDIEFNIDWIWHENWVRDECTKWAKEFHSAGVKSHGLKDQGADHADKG